MAGYLGIDVLTADDLADRAAVTAEGAGELGRRAAVLAASAWLSDAPAQTELAAIGDTLGVVALGVRVSAGRASGFSVRSVMAEILTAPLARRVHGSAVVQRLWGSGPGAQVVSVDVTELVVELEAAVSMALAVSIEVQHLDDGEAIITIRHALRAGGSAGLGAAAWVDVGDAEWGAGLMASAAATAGNWTERSWRVPENETGRLIASVLMDEAGGARAVIRTVNGATDVLVPERVEDAAGIGKDAAGWATGWLPGPSPVELFDGVNDTANYDRPAPVVELHGISARGELEVHGGAPTADAGIVAAAATGHTSDGDSIDVLELAGAIGGALGPLGLGRGATGSVRITSRDGDDDEDDSLDVVITTRAGNGIEERISVHADLTDPRARLGELALDALVGGPGDIDQDVVALLRSMGDVEITAVELSAAGHDLGAGIDLGVLARIGAEVHLMDHRYVPTDPFEPSTPGA